MRAKSLQACLTLCDLGTAARQAVRVSRQEHWSGLTCPPPGELPNPGIKPASLISLALAGGFFTTSAIWEAPCLLLLRHCSRVRLCATPQTAAHRAPQSLGISRQDRWSGVPFPSPLAAEAQAVFLVGTKQLSCYPSTHQEMALRDRQS